MSLTYNTGIKQNLTSETSNEKLKQNIQKKNTQFDNIFVKGAKKGLNDTIEGYKRSYELASEGGFFSALKGGAVALGNTLMAPARALFSPAVGMYEDLKEVGEENKGTKLGTIASGVGKVGEVATTIAEGTTTAGAIGALTSGSALAGQVYNTADKVMDAANLAGDIEMYAKGRGDKIGGLELALDSAGVIGDIIQGVSTIRKNKTSTAKSVKKAEKRLDNYVESKIGSRLEDITSSDEAGAIRKEHTDAIKKTFKDSILDENLDNAKVEDVYKNYHQKVKASQDYLYDNLVDNKITNKKLAIEIQEKAFDNAKSGDIKDGVSSGDLKDLKATRKIDNDGLLKLSKKKEFTKDEANKILSAINKEYGDFDIEDFVVSKNNNKYGYDEIGEFLLQKTGNKPDASDIKRMVKDSLPEESTNRVVNEVSNMINKEINAGGNDYDLFTITNKLYNKLYNEKDLTGAEKQYIKNVANGLEDIFLNTEEKRAAYNLYRGNDVIGKSISKYGNKYINKQTTQEALYPDYSGVMAKTMETPTATNFLRNIEKILFTDQTADQRTITDIRNIILNRQETSNTAILAKIVKKLRDIGYDEQSAWNVVNNASAITNSSINTGIEQQEDLEDSNYSYGDTYRGYDGKMDLF